MEVKTTEAWSKRVCQVLDEVMLQGLAFSLHGREHAVLSLLAMVPALVERLGLGVVLVLEVG